MRAPWKIALAGACVLCSAAAAQPFGPGGSEFRVNTYTSSYQETPSIAVDAAGGFLVAWRGGVQDGSAAGVFAQRFSAAFAPLGAELRVNTVTSSSQVAPAVASGPEGVFTVIWDGPSATGATFGQRFLDGVPQGGQFQAGTGFSNYYTFGAIGSNAAGDFVIAWSNGTFGTYGVLLRRFSAAGGRQGAEFRVNTGVITYPVAPTVARNASGSFVVVWPTLGDSASIRGQLFGAAGVPVGPEFRVDDAVYYPFEPAAAMGESGEFVVAWAQPSTGNPDVIAQLYDPTGARLGANFRINTFTSGIQRHPRVALGPAGFVAVWQSNAQDGSGNGMYGQRFASSGAPFGGEFRVNSSTTGNQLLGDVAFDAAGFIVVWTGESDGQSYGIFGRRFCTSVAGDANADGVLTVADVLYLINHLFAGGPPPLRSSDVNGDQAVSVGDVLYMINFLFAGGPAPVCVPPV